MKPYLFFCSLLTLGLLALLTCPSLAPASSCGTPFISKATTYGGYGTTHHASYATQHAVNAFIPVTVFQTVPVLVPTYTASYVPPVSVTPTSTQPTTQGNAAQTKAIVEALNKISQRLDTLEKRVSTGGNTPPSPPPSTPPGGQGKGDPFNPGKASKAPAIPGRPQVFAQKCIQCHQRGSEKGDFVLLEADGKVARLSDSQQLSLTKRLYKGQMPPKNNKLGITPLTDQEYGEVMAWLDSLK